MLYGLDLGFLLHLAGKHEESNRQLASAEQEILEQYTQKLSKNAETLIDPRFARYQARDLDESLAHILHALNYLFEDKMEDALVEARRIESVLQQRKSPGEDVAFSHLIAGMIFQERGKADDARISFEAAAKMYARIHQLFGTPTPTRIGEPIPAGTGEVVFLHYSGPGAQLKEREYTLKELRARAKIASTDEKGWLARLIDFSNPKFISKEYGGAYVRKLSGIKVSKTDEFIWSELVEDSFRIASAEIFTPKEFLQDMRAQACLSGLAKDSFGMVKNIMADRRGAEAAHHACLDLRSWSTLPREIRMARISLPPGRYSLETLFMEEGSVGTNLSVSGRPFGEVRVRQGRRTWISAYTWAW